MSLSSLNPYPLKFRPIAKERVWGGDRLAPFFQLDESGKIGEVWTLSGHPHGTSVCVNGPLAGQTLPDIVAQYPGLYLGRTDRDCFPLLVKFIHAEQDLSVQIHPDDAYAQKHEGDYGKTEAWYIVEADPGATVHYGHTFPNRTAYEKAVREGTVKDYLRYVEVAADDFIFVPSRTLHAIMGGVMLIEVQQTSDVTYRVYDWDRVDSNGKPRELHTHQAADVLCYEEQTVPDERHIVLDTAEAVQEHLIQCAYFTIDKWKLSARHAVPLGKKGQPDVLICAQGKGVLTYDGGNALPISQGDTLLIPATLDVYEVVPNDGITLLRAYY